MASSDSTQKACYGQRFIQETMPCTLTLVWQFKLHAFSSSVKDIRGSYSDTTNHNFKLRQVDCTSRLTLKL